jgi:hypothetical protein
VRDTGSPVVDLAVLPSSVPGVDVKTAVTEWQAGLKEWSEFPDVAAAALAEGLDGPSLRNLAGLLGLPWTEIQWQAPDLLDGVSAEVGVPKRTQGEALEVIVQTEAKRIVRGEVAPEAGAKRVYELFLRDTARTEWLSVGRFAEEWDDDASDEVLAGLRSKIIAAARGLT